jgi:hypothetical protein
MLAVVENDILEMNVMSRVKDSGEQVWSVSVRRGGHIQSIVGTECSYEGVAQILLKDLATDLANGKWEIGTMNGRPYAKRAVA